MKTPWLVDSVAWDNKMKKKAIEDYLVKSFEKWRERSKKQWKLDISVLADYGIKLDKIKEYESNK